ncbi:MAG: hypothetical protein P4L86_25415 [Mycobacterium sp.]|nr:hypothetical protein [Mycobacterium sp.]
MVGLALLLVFGGVVNVVKKFVAHHDGAPFIADVAPGQCITTKDFKDFHFTPTSCADSDAVYEFAGKTAMGLCPDGIRAQDGPYFYATPNQDDSKADLLCFALNLHEGNCYALDITAKAITHIDCTQAASNANSHTGVFRVSMRADGSTDATQCPTDTKSMVFIAPQRVYCLAKVVE